MKSIDLIIPVRNEQQNIKPLVERIHNTLASKNITYSIIFIDDHSTDKTSQEIENLSEMYPITYALKKGKLGKGYSILEGMEHCTKPLIAMLDGDLQYPPELLPEMIEKTAHADVVVANRKAFKTKNLLRQFVSRVGKLILGKLLFPFDCDIQSGMKVFTRELAPYIDSRFVSKWTFDLQLLHAAYSLGKAIDTVEIDFLRREYGISKVSLVSTTWEIFSNALKVRLLKGTHAHFIQPTDSTSMIGAGVATKGQRFITHTDLDHKSSALTTFTKSQRAIIWFLATVVVIGLIANIHNTIVAVMAVISVFYFADLLTNLTLIMRSLHRPPELSFEPAELDKLDLATLPTYTILCPLYKEPHVLPQFVSAMSALEWPKDKLEVMLLLEEDDAQTVEAAKTMGLPDYFKIVVVPHSMPKTKPKACNYGLNIATGEYIVIYDAEDKPDPFQLKKAYMGFLVSPKNTFCIQAKLNYYNTNHNLLTRLFAAEYALWFDVVLTGMQSVRTHIPLGGTSNHFRTKDLRSIKGWDAFNVAEDADLGIRLFKKGYTTAIVDSVTLEEATSNVKNWIRQRSRWIKGYMQTYLVHMRQPLQFFRDQKHHAILFQLTIGGKILSLLINPFLWCITIAYFTFRATLGPTIESWFPPGVFYMAVTSLVFGNFLAIYYYMIGCAKRGDWHLVKYTFAVPFYWLLISIAGYMALWQLFFKPHYWEKTIHGFHLSEEKLKNVALQYAKITVGNAVSKRSIRKRNIHPVVQFGLSWLTMVVNHVGILAFALLLSGQSQTPFSQSAFIFFISFTLFGSVMNVLEKGITYRVAYNFAKQELAETDVWRITISKIVPVALGACLAWFVAAPFVSYLFPAVKLWYLLALTPMLFSGPFLAVMRGVLTGTFKTARLLFSVLLENSILLGGTALALQVTHVTELIFAVIPLATMVAAAFTYLLVRDIIHLKPITGKAIAAFPFRFFIASCVEKAATFLFLVGAAIPYLLSPTPFVQISSLAYLLAINALVYYLANPIIELIVPLAAYTHGEGKSATNVFYRILLATLLMSLAVYATCTLAGEYFLLTLFGRDILPVVAFIPLTLLGGCLYLTSHFIATVNISRGRTLIAYGNLLLVLLGLGTTILFAGSLEILAVAIFAIGAISLLGSYLQHQYYPIIISTLFNLQDFASIFERVSTPKKDATKARILIFNWRDTKHAWAGGAEVYIHELAKHWVAAGHAVTLFCGNDQHSARNEEIDGVQIVRRGGFYTVYIWAFLYFVFHFRGKYDIIVDSANGVPFFTTLYSQIPKILLIHHVHQEVFKDQLPFPLAQIAMFIESHLMPAAYPNTHVATVSESTRDRLIQLKYASADRITVVHPGTTTYPLTNVEKTPNASFIYLGRLESYKNVDIAIQAFAILAKKYTRATMQIVGTGHAFKFLKRLTTQLGLDEKIIFTGKVSEHAKAVAFASSWAALQPSMMEGWGITVIEANAYGTPVIASDVPGLREAVRAGETGRLVPCRDAQAMAEAMMSIIALKQKRLEMSQKAVVWARTFSWEKSSNMFLELVISKWQKSNKFKYNTDLNAHSADLKRVQTNVSS